MLMISIAAANYGFNITSLLGSTTRNCLQVQDEMLNRTAEKKNLYANLTKTYQDNKSLSYEDLESVYVPRCKSGSHELHKFREIQCFRLDLSSPANLTVKQFCWCADPNTGHPINGVTEGPITKCGKSAAHHCYPSEAWFTFTLAMNSFLILDTVVLPQPCRFGDGEIVPDGDQRKVKDKCQIW